MDDHSQFHIAYRLAAHHHRITECERGLAQVKRNAFRAVMFLILWATGILTNSNSSRLSEIVSEGLSAGLNMLGG